MNSEPKLSSLASAYRVLEAHGHADGMLGHVSLRDPSGRGFWLKQASVGLDEVSGREQLLLTSFDGKLLEGSGPMHTEWPIHAAVLMNRPDIESVVHTHAPFASLLSAQGTAITPLTTEGGYFSNVTIPIFEASSAHIIELGDAMVMEKSMAGGLALLLSNHGLVTCGQSLAQAVLVALFLERAARQQIQAASTGLVFRPASKSAMDGRAAMLHSPTFVEQTFAYYARRTKIAPATGDRYREA
jgi:ribulose-5-phosphate 4-epimerase/fuculose-1-phosphate aldolase